MGQIKLYGTRTDHREKGPSISIYTLQLLPPIKSSICHIAPTTKEVEDVIEAEGSFTLQSLEVFKNDWDSYIKHADSGLDKKARAAVLATDIRAVGEPILATQFGEAAMDDLFHRFKEDVLDHMEMENCQYINLVISLTKKR
ncbi:hypothetical protein FF2_002895 [Malus domestica]